MLTSVGCAVGPSVTTSSTDFFFFQNLVFFGEFIWIFSKQKSLKNQYLSHFESQILPNKFPLNPVHRDLSNDNNTKGTLQFFWKSSATTYTSNFQSRNHSIFKELLPSKSKLHETKPIVKPHPHWYQLLQQKTNGWRKSSVQSHYF